MGFCFTAKVKVAIVNGVVLFGFHNGVKVMVLLQVPKMDYVH